jgi:3-hydroxyacyl-CoA dehydrogenase
MFAVSNCDTLALRMAERGDASMADIDIAMKLGAGYPMGYVNIIRFHA